jgi:hypothetical protein
MDIVTASSALISRQGHAVNLMSLTAAKGSTHVVYMVLASIIQTLALLVTVINTGLAVIANIVYNTAIVYTAHVMRMV